MRHAAGVAGEDAGCSALGDEAFIDQEVSRMYIIAINHGIKVISLSLTLVVWYLWFLQMVI